MVDPTGLIFGAIAIAWLLYIVPQVLAERDSHGPLEEDDGALPTTSMRVLHHQGADDVIDENLTVSTPLTRKLQMKRLNQLARQSAARRRGILLMLVATLIALIVASAVGQAPWWSVGMTVVGLIGWLGASRAMMAAQLDVMDRIADEIRYGDDEPTVALWTQEAERSVELSAPIEFAGSLWDPVPVTAPTYVQKPLASRTVRTIDLAAPHPASTALPPTADLLGTVEPGAMSAADDEVTEAVELPKAVGN